MWFSRANDIGTLPRNHTVEKDTPYSLVANHTKSLESSYDEQQERQKEQEDDDDDTLTITTGATFSTVMDNDLIVDTSQPLSILDTAPPSTSRSEHLAAFENELLALANLTSAPSRNTYFLDGGNRFISLPTSGHTSTKTAAHLSRVFEEWLQNKLYSNHDMKMMSTDRLPILEDSVDLLAEDILNKLKSRSSVRGLTGVSKVMIKVRTGHVYCLNQVMERDTDKDAGYTPPVFTSDMMDFFQQFPLFLDTTIYIMPKSSQPSLDTSLDDSIPILLTVENISTNPLEPYYLYEDVSLIV